MRKTYKFLKFNDYLTLQLHLYFFPNDFFFQNFEFKIWLFLSQLVFYKKNFTIFVPNWFLQIIWLFLSQIDFSQKYTYFCPKLIIYRKNDIFVPNWFFTKKIDIFVPNWYFMKKKSDYFSQFPVCYVRTCLFNENYLI